MNLIGKLAAFALGAALLSVFLKESKKEFVPVLQIAAGATMILALFASTGGQLGALLRLFSKTSLPQEDVALLLKGAAVCVVTELCAALCRENGNGAVGEVLVLSGRLVTLLLALPLLETVMDVALSFCT